MGRRNELQGAKLAAFKFVLVAHSGRNADDLKFVSSNPRSNFGIAKFTQRADWEYASGSMEELKAIWSLDIAFLVCGPMELLRYRMNINFIAWKREDGEAGLSPVGKEDKDNVHFPCVAFHLFSGSRADANPSPVGKEGSIM